MDGFEVLALLVSIRRWRWGIRMRSIPICWLIRKTLSRNWESKALSADYEHNGWVIYAFFFFFSQLEVNPILFLAIRAHKGSIASPLAVLFFDLHCNWVRRSRTLPTFVGLRILTPLRFWRINKQKYESVVARVCTETSVNRTGTLVSPVLPQAGNQRWRAKKGNLANSAT